jgi:hypothetical protein
MTDALDTLMAGAGTLPPVTVPLPTVGSEKPGLPAKPVPPVADPADGEALINLVDALTPTICRMWARRYKVKWDRTLESQARLTGDERKTLSLVAGSAAQFIPALLQHSPKIAACIFLYLYYTMLKDRQLDIEGRAPAPGADTPKPGTVPPDELAKRRANHEPTGMPRGRPKKK